MSARRNGKATFTRRTRRLVERVALDRGRDDRRIGTRIFVKHREAIFFDRVVTRVHRRRRSRVSASFPADAGVLASWSSQDRAATGGDDHECHREEAPAVSSFGVKRMQERFPNHYVAYCALSEVWLIVASLLQTGPWFRFAACAPAQISRRPATLDDIRAPTRAADGMNGRDAPTHGGRRCPMCVPGVR